MSLWSAVNTLVQGVKTAISNPIESFKQGAAAINPIVAHPVTTITEGYSAAKTQAYNETLYSNIKSVITTGATAAGLVIGGGAVAGSTSAIKYGSAAASAIGSVAKSSVSSIGNLGKTIAAAGGLLFADSLLSTSKRANTAVVNAPSSISNYAQNIGQFVDNPSFSNAWDIAKENPILTGATVIATGLAAGTTANTVATFLNTRATNRNSDENPIEVKIDKAKEEAQQIILKVDNPTNTTSGSPLVATSPAQNNPTTTVATTKKKTKKKKKVKKKVTAKKRKVYKKKSTKKRKGKKRKK